MPKKQKKAKKVQVVHLSQVKGFWSHFFAICTVILLGWLMLSPFVDWNPKWSQPHDDPTYHTSLNDISGVKDVPIRLVELRNKETSYIAASGQYTGEDMYVRPGQTVRLIFANKGTTGVYNLTIQGYKLYVVGWNNTPLEQVTEQDNVTILPGRNVHILFTPTWYGTIPVTAYYHTQGTVKNVEVSLLQLQIQGFPMLPSPLPITLVP